MSSVWLLSGFSMLGCRIFVPPEGAANRGPKESPELCARIKDSVYKRPDPMIYSQPFLGSQGLAVTWDNPDIHLERNGVVVNSSSLSPATEYDIVARIWNGSNIAPAIDFPVTFSYLEFGSKKQISAWLRSEYPDRPQWHICHETIYQALYLGHKGGGADR